MGANPIQNAFLATDPFILNAESPLIGADPYLSWKAAIEAMGLVLTQYCCEQTQGDCLSEEISLSSFHGLILSGPTPVLHQPAVQVHCQRCLWFPQFWARSTTQLLPGQNIDAPIESDLDSMVPLPEYDPLLQEQFCVVLTANFSWAAVLSHPEDGNEPFFSITFDPQTIRAILSPLLERVVDYRPGLQLRLNQWLQTFQPLASDYRWPMQFSRRLLTLSAQLKAPSIVVDLPSHEDPFNFETRDAHSQGRRASQEPVETEPRSGHDIELLKAIAHEIRTPLATIKTLTQLLMRRDDLPDTVVRRLEAIQQECTQQIDRFSLIFRAIELTTSPSASLSSSLTALSLQQLFAQKMARWETILERRSLEFDVVIPKDLPAVAIRDPNILDQVLTGLIEQLSQTLPLGSRISMRIMLAGEQLKLQLSSSIPEPIAAGQPSKSMLKAVGQLLMLQPETGSLSLSLPATKQIFNFLGGKLTVRQSSPQGEVLTMYLPLDPLTSSLI